MLRTALAALLTLISLSSFAIAPPTVSAQSVSCGNYDAWIWAQSDYDSDPAAFADLDPDGNEVACESLSLSGFAPVDWVTGIPRSAEAATVTNIVDGDTFDVSVNGETDRIRMYHINTPERGECGYQSATDFLAFVLKWAPGNTVYLEYDKTERDRYDRRLAYVWYEIGDDVYLVNDAMVRGGWADSDTFKPDDKYKEELDASEKFSVYHVLGVRLECGKFHQPEGSSPSNQQLRQAQQRQPNQGQFGDGSSGGSGSAQPQPEQPVQDPPQQAPSGNCDPSYPGVCIPPRSQVGDLDCGDISYQRFQVLPPDPHNFDGDFDGLGCEGGG